MDLTNKVQKYIETHDLLKHQHRLLIALSGGGDSVALLHLMLALGYRCEVAHVNFQLRGEASDRDEAFVRQLCAELQLTLHLKVEDTQAYAEHHKCSIEMAARDIRYAFFEELLQQKTLDYVIVAHHQDDVVETFFINLMRGTGLTGLSGMQAKRDHILRPLLACSHQELLQYLEDNGWSYCTDQTNFDTQILRNKLRHDIIPMIAERKPQFVDVMQQTLERLRASEDVLVAYAEEWKAKHCHTAGKMFFIDKEALYASPSPSELLYRLLRPFHFSPSIIDALAQAAEARVGARYYATYYVLTIDRETLVLSPLTDASESFVLDDIQDFEHAPLVIEADVLDRHECPLVGARTMAYFDADRVSFPLKMRRWQQGDVFAPFGMKGKQKKVSDFFIDQKLSQSEKEATWLLCQGDDILWVMGYRSDERFRVSTHTNRVLRLSII